MPSTYNDLYLDTRRALKRNGVDSAALEAREIVCCAADKNKEEFYRDNRLYATPEIEARVSALLQRRLQGEPVAYLVGEWEFFGLPLISFTAISYMRILSSSDNAATSLGKRP